MAITAINPTMRTLIALLAVVAGVLSCAIYLAANSPGRARAEAALVEANSRAEEVRRDALQRIETLERENADLRKQLEVAKANLDERAENLAAAEREALRLRGDLDADSRQLAELSRKYADARIKKAEDATAVALETEKKARLDADPAKKAPAVTAIKAPAAETGVARAGINKPGRKNGKNSNVAATKRRGGVASLPRTTPNFSELDTDHDGRLTLDEYKAGYPNVANVEEQFKALDTNGDGTLSIDEYKAGHPDPPVVHVTRSKKN